MKNFCKLGVLTIIFSLVFIAGINVYAASDTNTSDESMLNQLNIENEDNPESTKYLVTDDFISRVLPETSVKGFKANFSNGEEIKVFEDETCTKEVENGYVASGMYAKFESNGRVFKISVLGDIDSVDKEENNISGDGILNKIELTRILRNNANAEGWKIKDKLEAKSADITCDGNIDIKDVNSIIKYIVFGEIEIDGVKPVQSPKVEVIEGNKTSDGKYINNAKVKITQMNKENETLKTVYKITGAKTSEYKEINGTEEVIELEENGDYKITAYTYGTLENKSKGSSEIIEIVNGEVTYKVEHYTENLKENEKDETTYTLAKTENFVGTIGETVNAKAKKFEGYTEETTNAKRIEQGIVTEDGNLILRLYYKRNSYTVTFYDENGEDKLETLNIAYGADASYTGKTPSKPKTQKFTYTFNGWDEPEKLKNVTENRSVKATYTSTKNKYTVTFYDEEGKTELTKSTVDYGENVEKPATPTKAEDACYTYTFDNWYTGTDANATVDNLSNVTENRNVYAKYNAIAIEYNITYVLKEGTNDSRNPSAYTIEDTINLQPATREGYTFNGWFEKEEGTENQTTVISGRTGNITLYATWTANEINYVVEHYKEALDGTYVKDEGATEEIASTVDSEVSATAKTFTGFTYDENNANNVKEGTVPATGKLTLKLYYTRNRYILTLNRDEDTIKEVSRSRYIQIWSNSKYRCSNRRKSRIHICI